MTKQTTTVFISKYALTTGIFSHDAELDGSMAYMKRDGWTFGSYYHGQGKEWHLTEAEAIARAEVMRDKKIASLQKQIAALQSKTDFMEKTK